MNSEQAVELLRKVAAHPEVLKVYKEGADPVGFLSEERTSSLDPIGVVRLSLTKKDIEETVYLVWSGEEPADIAVHDKGLQGLSFAKIIEELKQ